MLYDENPLILDGENSIVDDTQHSERKKEKARWTHSMDNRK